MRLLLILAPALLLVSCAHVGVTTLRAANPKVATCSLDIYSSPEEIKKPYEVLCLLDARTGTTAFAERSGAGAINEARHMHAGVAEMPSWLSLLEMRE